MHSPARTRRFAAPLLMGLLLALCALAALPATAYARDYSIDRVDIDATVSEDGKLLVKETRTFDFNGSFNGVYWDIPAGYNPGNGKDVQLTVLGAGEGDASSLDEFEPSDSGDDGTYEEYYQGDVLRLKIYSAHSDEKARFTIVYEADGIATRWEDTGELYWKFVSDGWDVESRNVTCALHLPVPSGESVSAGDNVRAWGHGPLDASVSFSGDEVDFNVPGVGTDEYAEMRVAFPASWIAGCEQTSGSRLQAILSEEQRWADEANAQRARARIAMGLACGLGAALAVGTLLATFLVRRTHERRMRPQFQDDYFRDVPTADHPAVLGALYNGGKVEPKELTATFMRMTDAGKIKLEKVKLRKKGVFGDKVIEDYRVTRVGAAAKGSFAADEGAEKVDKRALHFIFNVVGGAVHAPAAEVCFKQFKAAAKDEPEKYERGWDDWAGLVEGQCEDRFCKGGVGRSGMGLLIALGILDVLAAFAAFFVLLVLFEAPLALGLGMVAALIAVAVAAFVCAGRMRDLNREGIETLAELKALRRWLKEFTRLDEAVPEDVVLWNRLLVMAVVLGVADEVIEQLKVALPQVLDDPYFGPCYGWCYGYGPMGPRPSDVFSQSIQSAHSVSTAALSASSDSSGGGGGGGFSGGGGGGFGGGGGGGAF